MKKVRAVTPLFAALLLTTAPTGALAQGTVPSAPQAVPLPPPIPAARDVPYPGTVELAIDASDPDWPARVLDATGGGVDLLVDFVAGPAMNPNMRATRICGRIRSRC